MKRFYKAVTVTSVAKGYEIHLDDRPVRTPSKAVLLVPAESLAHAVQAEWEAQIDEIIPDNMPLTQILTTAQDRVSKERPSIHKTMMAYLDTDLLCYRATQPEDIADKQAESWDKWLDWFDERFEAPLQTTTALVALRQSDKARKAAADYAEALDDLAFTILQLVTVISGSMVLGLAFMENKALAADIYDTMHVEEHFKADFYGEDKYGADPQTEKKRKNIMRDLEASRVICEALASV